MKFLLFGQKKLIIGYDKNATIKHPDYSFATGYYNYKKLSLTLPNVETKIIACCGHLPHEEYPKKVAGLFTGFLSTNYCQETKK